MSLYLYIHISNSEICNSPLSRKPSSPNLSSAISYSFLVQITFHNNFKDFFLLHNLFSLALWAAISVVDGFSSTLAFIASMLHLLNHGRAKMSYRNLHTSSLTTSTLHRSTRLRTLTENSQTTITGNPTCETSNNYANNKI